MDNFIQNGGAVQLPVPYATITAGAGMLVGALFGVAAVSGVSGDEITVETLGVYDLTKQPSLAIAQGARVFWDDTNRRVTTTPGSNIQIGTATAAAGSSDTTCRVRLDGIGGFPGTAVVARVATLTPTAAASTDSTITLPACRILAIYQRTTTAFTGNTVTVAVGTAAGGGQIVAAVDIKAKANRTLTLVDAGADTITPFAGGTVHIRIAQTSTETAVGAGELIFVILPSA